MYPSLDLTIRALNVVPTHRLRCEATPHDAGGGVDGLPVARVLTRLGAACQSLCPPGGPRGEWLKHRMAQGVAFTLGHLGALLVIREARWSAPAQPVQAIGAVGGRVTASWWTGVGPAAGAGFAERARRGVAADSEPLLSASTGLCCAAPRMPSV